MTPRPPGGFDETTLDRPNRSGALTRLLRGLKIAGIAVVVLAASIGGYWGILQYQGNFHTVNAGLLYRSAQLSGNEIKAAVGRYAIKSVLNLRGAHTGEAWYDEEMAASNALGLVHFDYKLSATRVVTAEQIGEIIAILRQAPKPLLIHCKSGADRTGLVAALYLYSDTGASAERADRELSLIYGHFPYLMSRSGAMDESFWSFVRGAPQPVTR